MCQGHVGAKSFALNDGPCLVHAKDGLGRPSHQRGPPTALQAVPYEITMTRNRVAHITLGLATGGQEKLLVEFARRADREQFDLVFVSLTDRGKLADTIESHGWPVVALNAPGGLRPGLVWRLRRLFRERRIDIVHTHDDRPLIYGVPAGRTAGARVIHTQHHGLLPGTSRSQLRLTRWAGRLAHEFVTVSEDAARHLIEQGLPAGRVSTIWNGIDLDRFAFTGCVAGGPVVCVARLSPEKNIADLLRAAAIVSAKDANFRLKIAGDGPCRAELATLAQELKLGPNVEFLGEVRDIPSLLAEASLFVLPSKSEGISLTLLEAMARGLPVATTRVGGNPEVVEQGQTGLLAPSQDPAALAAAILEARGDADMGRAGRARVETHFDVAAMVRKYETLYVRKAQRRSSLGFRQEQPTA